MIRPVHIAAIALGALTLVGCAPGASPIGPDAGCSECAGSRDALLADLDGHADPIAAFLRGAATERGTVTGDYRDVLGGVGEILGCGADSARSFVVVTNAGYRPKIVFARCARDTATASRFLLNVPELDGSGDMEPQVVHMAAWDPDAEVYHHYETRPAGGEMAVEVEPPGCLHCHGGRYGREHWMPLMNEIAAPWSQWHAGPGFASQLFDDYLDPAIASGDDYREMTRDGLLHSAAELEPIVRAGLDRVAAARLRRRHREADVDEALALVRPLFCDEHVNYASEIHDSGEIALAAAVDRSLGSLTRLAYPDASWPWTRRSLLRLPPRREGDPELTLLPVRSELARTLELGLVSRRVLGPETALQIRALDWQRPALSAFRCGLFERGRERIEQGALAADLDELPGGATTEAVVPLVVGELLAVIAGGERVPIEAGAGRVVAIADAGDPVAAEKLAAGDLAAFEISVAAFGDAVQAHIDGIQTTSGRAALAEARRELACTARARYPASPLYPDLSCPEIRRRAGTTSRPL